MDEAALIVAARAGNQEAFATLYQRNAAYVRAIGRSALRTKDVDDMCQEVFMRAFTGLQHFKGGSQFRTWLSRIAINYCLTALQRVPPIDSMQSESMLGEDEECCRFVVRDASLENVATRLDAEKLLGLLKPRQRSMLEMAYVEEVTELEIAMRLGTTLPAVKSQMQYAKRRLRRTKINFD